MDISEYKCIISVLATKTAEDLAESLRADGVSDSVIAEKCSKVFAKMQDELDFCNRVEAAEIAEELMCA